MYTCASQLQSRLAHKPSSINMPPATYCESQKQPKGDSPPQNPTHVKHSSTASGQQSPYDVHLPHQSFRSYQSPWPNQLYPSPAYKSSQKHPLRDCPPHESTQVSSAGGDGGSKHCTSTSAPSFRHQPPAYSDPLLINSYLQARLRLGSSLRKMYTCGPQTKGIKASNTLTDSHRSFCLGANLQIVTEASTGRLSPA